MLRKIKALVVYIRKYLLRTKSIRSSQRKFLENTLLPSLIIKGKVIFIGIRDYCHYESFLSEGMWINIDISPGFRPDVAADIHNMSFRSESLDWVLFNGVFEYLSNPFVALEEIRRILKPGGWLLFGAPYHTLDRDGGLWRITSSGVDFYLADFEIRNKHNIKNKHIYCLCRKPLSPR
ncbi:class I SAM-dependent methyltransferase [Candidatus Parcubacteria bacterium]|nr:MAG: class I SAM-dependent methyltransferase [Candidatus Parcubacteria bacterium]